MKKYLVVLTMLFIFVGCGSSSVSSDGVGLSVKINSDNSQLVEGESITFDANVTGSDGVIDYEWTEGNDTLGTESSLTKDDFTVGSHTIVINVFNSGESATDSITVNVSEFLVNLASTKSIYNLDENITLDSNVTGTLGSVVTYSWADSWTKVDNSIEDKNLTENDAKIIDGVFGVGKHSVTVTVDSDGSKKSDSVDFTLYDLNVTTVSDDGVVIQASKNLMWVSDSDTSKEACLAVKNDGNYTISETFCENLTFAGSMDWRKPKTSEVVAFVKDTVAVDILPAYYAPCKLLIGANDTNGSNEAIVTRYGAGLSDFGELGAVIPVKYNIGLRCVRDN